MLQRFSLFLFAVLLTVGLAAQNTIRGIVLDADNNAPVEDAAVVLNGTGLFAATDANGQFVIQNVPNGPYTVTVSHIGFLPLEQKLDVRPTVSGETRIELAISHDQTSTAPSGANTTGDIPTVTLDEAESETEGAAEVANVLHASRDVFQTLSGFGWSTFRFRERGYESEHFPLFLNGVSINDPETGSAFFGEFGGLNDVLRNRSTSIGLEPAEFAFSEIGGATNIDTRASTQRKQIRFSHAETNRAYRHRTMLTMSTGLMPGGWAVTVSGSKRWANEGYVPGTFFDGYSYFASLDKKIGTKHALNLTVFGAPTRRGRATDSFKEMFEIAGTNYYNPSWGYQNGEKRNSNVAHSNQPMAILRYDLTPDTKTNITFSTYVQGGKRGDSRIEWYNDLNPAPDYNRSLPSSFGDLSPLEEEAKWRELLTNNEALRQINWDNLYQTNSNSFATIQNADGQAGNTVSGKRARYIVEDRRADSRELGSNLTMRRILTDRITLQAGANYQIYQGRNFKTVDDLLGADFWVDVNKFAERDFLDDPSKADIDLATPNNVVRQGEVFGYNYDENIRKGGAWAQVQFNLPKFQFFVGGEGNQNNFWRTGRMQSGLFPDNSLGDAEKLKFTTYGGKGGVTYKVNGRNYFYANAFYGTRPMQFRDVYLRPRINNDHLTDAKPYTVTSGEAGYMLRSPYYRARVTGYYTKFDNMIDAATLFSPNSGGFGTRLLTGVDQVNSGVEIAIEAKIAPQLTVSGATNLGYYRFSSRPTLSFTQDYREGTLDNVTVFQNNFLVPRTPQTLGAVSLRYEGRKFWFASISLNYADNMWFDFDPTLLTREFVGELVTQGLKPGDEIFDGIIAEEKAPANYTLDFFAGKSWRIKYKYFVNLNAGVNNILNNQNIITSGRYSYQSSFREVDDLRRYNNEIIYAPGLNYFVSLTFRMN